MKKEVKIGYTNKVKYVHDSKFVIKKTLNGFNHKLDYRQTQTFAFVPKLVKDNQEEVVFDYVKAQQLTNPTSKDLQKVAVNLRKIHLSNIKLPKNNFAKRARFYVKKIHEKNLCLAFVDNNWKEMFKLIKNMSKTNPCHNDVWFENLLKDPGGKIWFVDWEYATMGDKHFDLAFYIGSQKLGKKQKQIFLEAYNSVENRVSYQDNLIDKYYKFACWLTVCWAYAQDEIPFDISWMIDAISN